MRNQYKIIFAITFVIFLSAQILVHAVTAEIVSIDNRAYGEAVLRELNNATRSIDVAMYSIYIKESEQNTPAYQLFNALLTAHNRGVAVRVFLDRSETNSQGNVEAYRLLRNAGVEVYLTKPEIKLHAKLIIIDHAIVIDGSANWTDNALTKNFESNYIIKSAEFAAQKEAFFDSLQANVDLMPQPIAKNKTIRIPYEFLENKELLGAMVEKTDEYTFDLYLLFLKNALAKKEPPFNYQQTARYLGIKVDTQNGNYKRDLNIVLDKLKNKYSLTDYASPKTAYIDLSASYFDHGYDRKLRLREKAALLIALREQSRAWPRLYWRRSLEKLQERYHVKSDLLSLAFQELKRQNLLEIAPSTASPDSYDNRQPNQYRVKPFTSSTTQKRAWNRLEGIFGKGIVDQSRILAESFDEQNNPRAVERLCYLVRRYGIDKVEVAVNKIHDYAPTNPLKNIAHVEAICNTHMIMS
jgi:HKD family nuclease